ncbi:hypothetical protein ABFX02_14G055900 [Erythranthe guttata]
MNYYGLRFFAVLLVLFGVVMISGVESGDVAFDTNYNVVWGDYKHASVLKHGRQARLSLDAQSGAGFVSKQQYGSGFFNMRIKLAGRNTAGVVTAFYLASSGNYGHDELDFEFLGDKEGKPIRLQTNVFANGKGNREQKVLLWFDPAADYHDYKILWNHRLIAFYVDDIPIRVFRNNKKIGVEYPTQAMQIHVSIWNGDSWATDGGRTKINWTYAPFTAHFQSFNVDGCPSTNGRRKCHSASSYWWNQRKYWNFNRTMRRKYQIVRDKFMNYDYCNDTTRHPTTPPECAPNQFKN